MVRNRVVTIDAAPRVQCVYCHSCSSPDGATGWCRLFSHFTSMYRERACDGYIDAELATGPAPAIPAFLLRNPLPLR